MSRSIDISSTLREYMYSASQVLIYHLYHASVGRIRYNKLRSYGNLDNFEAYINLVSKSELYRAKYNIYSISCFTKCAICNTYVHYFL